ncbi:MAG: SRPBCC domain-containing protein [bacterium]|nr:SRPBCC domain-containing protein [bacterium]
MQDVIRREVTINASKEIVYEAIANPEKVVLWFPHAIEGKYEVGENPILSFGKDGKAQIHIVDAKPYEYFAYRWVPGRNHFIGDVLSVPHTLVEFKIQKVDGEKCTVTVIESGFAELPIEMAENAFKQNSGGWEFMLGRLNKYFQQ